MVTKLEAKFNRSLKVFPFILVFYEVIHYLANDMYLPALPILAKELKTSIHVIQLTITVWFLGAASMHLLLGPLSDRIGRRPVLLGGGIVFIISTFYCALTSDVHYFLAARFFQGCAACAIGTAGYSSIHECFDQRDAIRLLAIMGSITILSPALGPLAGSFLLHWLSWRWVFGILGIAAIISWMLLGLWMPESNPHGKRQILSWKKIIQNYIAILSNPHFMLNVFIFCFTFLGMIAWIAAGPFLVIDRFHLSGGVFGIFQAMVFGSLMIGSQIVRHWASKIEPYRLIHVGLFLSFIGGVMAFTLTWLFSQCILGLVFSLMLFTLGSSIAFGPAQRLAIEACSEPMGARMAVLSSLISWFGFMGGMLVSMTYSGTLFWMGSLILILAMAACGCRILERYLSR